MRYINLRFTFTFALHSITKFVRCRCRLLCQKCESIFIEPAGVKDNGHWTVLLPYLEQMLVAIKHVTDVSKTAYERIVENIALQQHMQQCHNAEIST